MFTVNLRDESETFRTRKKAIDAAREKSSDSPREPVHVNGDNGESMTFNHGQLQTYTFHTRGRGGN